jgi:hypothetical protein
MCLISSKHTYNFIFSFNFQIQNDAKRSDRDNVLHLFDKWESNITKFGFTPDKIFILDECGFSTVQERPHKIVTQKGFVASGERGVNTTVVCAASAAGIYTYCL